MAELFELDLNIIIKVVFFCLKKIIKMFKDRQESKKRTEL